ncbi:hypothetical protein F4808DRAFT_105525 [Astrocystis sublimbata]|nr:hypothetical protein F4808DRAFT_105525 [Astrocystis sublimbata]
MDLQDAINDFGGFTAFGGGSATAFSASNLHDLDASPVTNTVSPVELLQFSAPNSSVFTDLTTPSAFGESPGFENYDISPNFGDLDAGSSDDWFSLFPDTSTTTDQASAPVKSSAAAPAELEKPETDSLPRRKSSNSSSPPTTSVRHSTVSGVNARRRDKPLPPILVDDDTDPVAMKRARNTLAARKSRQRKAEKMEELEERIAELERDRDHWKKIALSRTGGV